MADITLVKQPGQIPEADREAARRVLFGIVDGLGERGRRQWRRFVNGLMRLEPGEMVEIRTHRERIGWYHRKHMVLEVQVFEAQERFEQFKAFRDWLKIGAGHCEWVPGPKGAVVPIPKSIAYSELGQDEMEEFHTNAIAFLRSPHALKVMWPKASPEQREGGMETLLDSFGSFAQ